MALERRDIDRAGGIVNGTPHRLIGEIVELGKTSTSRRQVPLSPRALAALDDLPPRLDMPLLFPAKHGGLLNIDNFRRREWAPAIEASGIRKPARIYDLRRTFASNAIAAGVGVFELARVMGTSDRDDRTPLRDAARRRRRGDREPSRRIRGRVGAGRPS